VVAGRKVGRAVDRNRAKRRLRAALTDVELPTQMDFAVVARARVLTVNARALRSELAELTGGSYPVGAAQDA
jgi:ribonuclease P protein component